MKDIYKKPTFYYLAVPILVGLWPLVLWAVSLPGGRQRLERDRRNYTKAGANILEILDLDPGRLEAAGSADKADEFDYTKAVNNATQLCSIPAAKYKLSSGIIVTSGGQKSQNAKVNLKELDITRFARFLSTMQLRWANLQCTQIRMTRKKGAADNWDFDMQFKYYY